MDKKTPIRKCVGCGVQKDKREFIRVVRTVDGDITIDFKGKMNGRGAYLCKNPDCLVKAGKNKGLERAFKLNIPDSVISKLKEELEIAE